MTDHAAKHTGKESHIELEANIMLYRFLDMTHESAVQDRLATGARAQDPCGKREEIKAIIAAVEAALSSGHGSEVVAGKEEGGFLAAGLSSSDASLGEGTVEMSGGK